MKIKTIIWIISGMAAFVLLVVLVTKVEVERVEVSVQLYGEVAHLGHKDECY